MEKKGIQEEVFPRVHELPFYPFMVIQYEKNMIKTLQHILESIEGVALVCQISPFGFHVYIQQENGFLSKVSYKIYRYQENDYLISSDKVRTYDDGGELCVEFFHKFCEKIDLDKDITVKQGREQPRRSFCSLVPSSASDRYSYPIEEEETSNLSKWYKKSIQSIYWEHQRYGLSNLPLIPTADTESVMIVLDYLEKKQNDSEMVLLAIICLKKLLLRHHSTGDKNIQTKIRHILQGIKEEMKISSYPFFFHHGVLKKKDAENIAGMDMPGSFIVYTDVEDNITRIMVYQSWVLETKKFVCYEISIHEDKQTIGYKGETYPDIWCVLFALSLGWYHPIYVNATSPVNGLIHKQIDEILMY